MKEGASHAMCLGTFQGFAGGDWGCVWSAERMAISLTLVQTSQNPEAEFIIQLIGAGRTHTPGQGEDKWLMTMLRGLKDDTRLEDTH